MGAVQDDDDENENQNANTQNNRDAGNTISLFWSYTMTVLGIALSFGLLLNLFGYAYIIDPEEGLRVDTIQQLRTEQQFRAEAKRLSINEQPPSTLRK
jgi:LPS O-antigen subunit length determinant protein (WzzB/FepE family)